jgi:hypothetical protein
MNIGYGNKLIYLSNKVSDLGQIPCFKMTMALEEEEDSHPPNFFFS